jgi:DNA polymerase I-like protein with 3'-5' exonuclease and polymerase domains
MGDPWFDILPQELPVVDKIVTFDTETSGLYPDEGAQVCVVSVAWREGEEIRAYAWPFNQGLYGKPEYLTAFFGQRVVDEPILGPDGEQVLLKTGPRKGQVKTKKARYPITADEALPSNPNLGPTEWEALCRWLSKHRLNAHNGLFDVIMMGADTDVWGPDEGSLGELSKMTVPGVDLLDNLEWDTMLGNRIVFPQYPLGLEDTAARLFGGGKTEEQDAIKAHLKSRRLPYGKGKWHLADWDVMGPYAVGDSRLTAPLGAIQWQEMKDRKIPFARMHDELDKLKALVRMERKGLPYHARESLNWAEKLEARMKEIEAELPFGITPNAVRQFYFTKDRNDRGTPCLGLKPEKLTDGGQSGNRVPAVDAEVIKKLAEANKPHARTYQEWRSTADAVTRYYRGYGEAVGKDGKLRTRFRQTGTATLRLSCERINLQAIPHDHRLLVSESQILKVAPSPRALVHPIPGYRLWHMDLEQAELRVATQKAPSPSMLAILEAGLDPHGETAISLGLADGPDHPDWFKARSVVGKRSNFSLIFGIGPVKFREDLGKNGLYLPLSEVRKIHGDWHALYPEFSEAIDMRMEIAKYDGRTRIRGDVWKWYTEREKAMHDWHKAFNNEVQGNIGLFTGHWMVEVDQYCQTLDIDPQAGLMLQIHDALVCMFPANDEGDAMAEHCAQIGRDMWDQWFTVPGGVELKEWKSA